MLDRFIRFSLHQPLFIIMLVGIISFLGLNAMFQLPIDAVPDITTNQVNINSMAPGWTPLEIEKQITFPVEVAMSSLPKIEEVRSLSKFGLSQVTVVFHDNVDIYFARQLVLERLQNVKKNLPREIDPIMGPVTTGLGEIYQYSVEGEGKSLMDLRTIQNWIIAPRLRTVPGLAEVNSWGGYVKQYQVLVNPAKLLTYGITLHQVFEGIAKNNANVGAAFVEHAREQYLIRGVGLIRSIQDIEQIAVITHEGTPVYVRDVASVQEGNEIRQGSATKDGKEEVVIGVAMLLKGENSRTVVERVKERLKEIQASLPHGITIRAFYDRSDLIKKTIHTVVKNLAEGGLLVVFILFILLGNWRAGLIVASVIPISMLIAFTGMGKLGVSGNLMSLGAIDFGLIVDGAVVMVENVICQASLKKKAGMILTYEKWQNLVFTACSEVGSPVFFGVAIITLVYIPILTLEGIEGNMFKPMAATVILALGASLALIFTWIPSLCATFLKTQKEFHEPIFVEPLKKIYLKFLDKAFCFRIPVLTAAFALVVASFFVFLTLGAEFIPRLDEGSIALEFRRLPSVSITEATRQSLQVEKILKKFPEVEAVISRTGTAEIATDPMGPEMSDVLIMLKPRQSWKTAKTKNELIEKMEEALSVIPGIVISFSQPIELRFNELISGVRSDLAVKIFGNDLEILKEKGEEISRVIQTIQGAEDTKIEQTSGLPVLSILINREKIARYGLNVLDIEETIETAIGGKQASAVLEENKQFAIQVRFPEETRRHPKEIGNILLSTPEGGKIPLSQVASLNLAEGPAQISREHGERRVVIATNVRKRDIGSFVKEAETRIQENVKLPTGYYLEWGGQFQNLERGKRRLLVIVPLILLLIFILLFTNLGSISQTLLVFTGIPLAVSGGVFSLALRGMPFSISAGVGFIALFGIAVLNGLVMVSYINKLRQEGFSIKEAVLKGASLRLRPILMTALVAALGFLPMALAATTGAEVQKPLATVVIGGLASSTLLTLFILPLLYTLFEREKSEIEI